MITITAKLYKDTEWSTERADMVVSPAHAAHMLSGWTRMYARPEVVRSGPDTKFWFRDGKGFNLLVTACDISIDELRAAWRGRDA